MEERDQLTAPFVLEHDFEAYPLVGERLSPRPLFRKLVAQREKVSLVLRILIALEMNSLRLDHENIRIVGALFRRIGYDEIRADSVLPPALDGVVLAGDVPIPPE